MGAPLSRGLLLDNSAWARLGHPDLPLERADEVAGAIEHDRLFVCAPMLLEAGYSARNRTEYVDLTSDLVALPWAALDEATEHRALRAQAQLARRGHHRLPPVDILIGALADRHRLGVLHYDRDYDLIEEATDLSFESVWLAERGSL